MRLYSPAFWSCHRVSVALSPCPKPEHCPAAECGPGLKSLAPANPIQLALQALPELQRWQIIPS